MDGRLRERRRSVAVDHQHVEASSHEREFALRFLARRELEGLVRAELEVRSSGFVPQAQDGPVDPRQELVGAETTFGVEQELAGGGTAESDQRDAHTIARRTLPAGTRAQLARLERRGIEHELLPFARAERDLRADAFQGRRVQTAASTFAVGDLVRHAHVVQTGGQGFEREAPAGLDARRGPDAALRAR